MRKYSGKIMWFGEYTVLLGGSALIVPAPQYFGNFSHSKDKDDQLLLFFNHLKQFFSSRLDIETLDNNWQNGLFFESNIPIGYGLGSSGALTAAVYDQYFLSKPDSIIEMKQELALIESFFHGKSSGLDALVSYLNQPILVSNGDIQVIDHSLPMDWFSLVNTETGRNTNDYVQYFLAHIKPQKLKELHTIMQLTDKLIDAVLNKEKKSYTNLILQLSELQFDVFRHMILPSLILDWEKALKNKSGVLKLCGAGGGGFYLRSMV